MWLFFIVFFPLFICLGVWQLNRAEQKDQLSQSALDGPVLEQQLDWQAVDKVQSFLLTASLDSAEHFLLDNKTRSGQFGYEVFVIVKTERARYAMSLGWVSASVKREVLPSYVLPRHFKGAKAWLRSAPVNPVFGSDANIQQADENIWVVQTLNEQWLFEVTGKKIKGFLQLAEPIHYGVGENIWQPSVMSAAKHRGYALQWFGMAIALLLMFLYAGLHNNDKNNKREKQ